MNISDQQDPVWTPQLCSQQSLALLNVAFNPEKLISFRRTINVKPSTCAIMSNPAVTVIKILFYILKKLPCENSILIDALREPTYH